MVSSNNNNNNNPLSLNISRVIRLEIDRKFHVFFVPVATPYIYTPVHSIRILISSCHRDTYTLSLSLLCSPRERSYRLESGHASRRDTPADWPIGYVL